MARTPTPEELARAEEERRRQEAAAAQAGLEVAGQPAAIQPPTFDPTAAGAGLEVSVGGAAGAAAEGGVHPSRAEVGEGDRNPNNTDGRLSIIATTGDIIEVISKNGRVKINIPKTEGMSHSRIAEVASSLIAAAMIHGAFTMKKDENGVEKPHFKIVTKNFILRAAMEQQLDILGFTYDKEEPAKRSKEKQEHDKEYSPTMGGILPALSLLTLGIIPDRLPSRYENAIDRVKKIVRENNAKSTQEYAAEKATGDSKRINSVLESRELQCTGFFNRFIAGASQVNPDDENLPADYKRRVITHETFRPNAEDAEKFFAKQDSAGCRKAGDKRSDGSYVYLNRSENPEQRLNKIAKLGIGEGNGWNKPEVVRDMTGEEFARNTKLGLEAISAGRAARSTVPPRPGGGP